MQNKLDKSRLVTVGIDLSTGKGTCALPTGFDRYYTSIIGWRARNIYGGMYSNYTSSGISVYIGDSGVTATSSGNFSGTNAYIWVTLLSIGW